jgi:pSer/pThr/pTyr-binding forkhead associated (FHA) protein
MSPPVPVLRFPGPSPLWASGRFVLRVTGGSSGPRLVPIDRACATIGREPGNDVLIDAPGVAARHVYLHLDRRGLYAVDLASRWGTRVGRAGRPADWLEPGEALELGGRGARVELLELEVDGPEPAGPGGFDPLSDTPSRPLAQVTLFPFGAASVPMVLHSELVFVGRSPACGVTVDDPAAAAVQCVLVRDELGAYVADLAGRSTWLNSRPLREAAPLRDGDVLGVGASRLECRVGPAPTLLPARATRPIAATPMSMPLPTPPEAGRGLAVAGSAGGPLADASQESLMAWLLGMVQATQGELLRRQSEFQDDLMRTLRGMQSEQAEAMRQHRDQVSELHRDLSSLRDDVRRRFAAGDPAGRPLPAPPAPPQVPPAPPAPGDNGAAAAWLARRIDQVKREGRGRGK